MIEETTLAALRLNVKLERKLDKRRKMDEQERREAYFTLTGKIATSDHGGYFAFCKGIEYERERMRSNV